MDDDRHRIWRYVAAAYEEREANCPDGHRPVVEVFLVGRTAPIRIGTAQTFRRLDFPWTFLFAALEADDPPPSPNQRAIFVPDQFVERVEISYERSESPPIGFAHSELAEPSATSDE